MRSLLHLVLGAIGVLPVSAFAQVPTYFDFHPLTKMTVARGLDPNDLSIPKSVCVNAEIKDADSAGAGIGDIAINFVSEASHVREAVHMDASVDASYAAFSGSASYNFDRSFDRDERSISIVVGANSDYSRREVIAAPNAQSILTAHAQSLLDAQDYPSFLSECGSHYVVIERRGVMLAAVITIRESSENTRNAIRAEMSAKGNYGAMSAGAKASFSQEMQRANSQNRVNVHVTYNGGPGLAALADLVQTTIKIKTNVDEIGASLATYLKQIGKENAAPLGYSVIRYPGLPEDASDFQFEMKQKALRAIVSKYRFLEKISDDIGSILSGRDARAQYFPPKQIQDFERHKIKIDAYLRALADSHVNCKKARKTAEDISTACVLPGDEPKFGFLDLPPANAAPVLGFRGLLGEDYESRILNELDSSTLLRGFGPSNLLERARTIVPTADHAAAVVMINSYYLDGFRIFVVPSEELAKRYVDRIKELNLVQKSRRQLPKFADDVLADDVDSPYYRAAVGLYEVRKDDTPVILISDYQERKMGAFEMGSQAIFSLYRKIDFPAVVVGFAGGLKEAKGYVDIFVEARDIFDNRARLKLFRLEWWNFDFATYKATMRVMHESGLPDEILDIHGVSPEECKQRLPEFLCKGMPKN